MTSPESRLLRQLLLNLDDRTAASPLLKTEGIDWNRFQALVRNHRLGPLFHRGFPPLPAIPPDVRRDWEELFNRQLAGLVLSQNILEQVLASLAAEGIAVLVLKGAHLREAYYPHPVFRPVDDIDLLIHSGDREKAGKLLQRRDFLPGEETATADKFAPADSSVFIEVHVNLQTAGRKNPSFEIEIDDFWENSRQTRIAGAPARVLTPDLNLLYLAAHLSHHGFERLIWFYDLHLIMEKEKTRINWDFLIERATHYRCRSQVYYPLLMTGFFFGKPAPAGVLSRLAPTAPKKLLTRFFINPGAVLDGRIPVTGWKALRNRFLLNDNWWLALKKFFAKN